MEGFFTTLSPNMNSGLPTLSEEEQQFLRQQTIDENQPGAIAQDFQILLDFLRPKGIEVSSVNNLLPLKILTELNSRLSHPIEIKLKRPVQKSYPYINGLYLLLRCCGICQIKSKGMKQLLVIDEAVYDSWSNLNSTERYFTLLETWLLWGNDEVIGERQDALGNLYKILMFWQRIPEKGLKFTKYQDQDGLSYYPGLYNIALLELFGFLAIKQGKPQEGKGWRITNIQRLPFGDLMLKLLFSISIEGDLDIWEEDEEETEIEDDFLEEDEEETEIEDDFLEDENVYEKESEENQHNFNITFGEFQPYFLPFFPEWEKNLIIPELEFVDGIYIFKVSLPRVWRRIAIPAKRELSSLAQTILYAFEFDDDHLYEFSYKSRFGQTITVSHPYMKTSPSADEVRIGDLCLEPGARMRYLYDFGDNWQFDVQLETINPPDSKVKKPEILEFHGDAPSQYWSEDEEYDEEE
jgi:hypothetical protein